MQARGASIHVKNSGRLYKDSKSLVIALVLFDTCDVECYKDKCTISDLIVILNRLSITYRIVLPNEEPICDITHIIIYGNDKQDIYKMPQWILDSNKPVLGINHGMCLIAHTFGASILRNTKSERGLIPVYELIGEQYQYNLRWLDRWDHILMIGQNFKITGLTHNKTITSFTDNQRWWAIQYHPEANAKQDIDVLTRFFNINIR